MKKSPKVAPRERATRILLAALAAGAVPVCANAQSTTVIVQNRTTVTVINQRPAPQPGVAEPVTLPPPNFAFDPQELTPYLNGRCAELWQLLHVPSRQRVYGPNTAALNREERDQCTDQEYAARQRLFNEKRAQYADKTHQAIDARNQLAQNRASKEQCDEMLRILAGKKKRFSELTDGQKDDLAHFEDVYAQRCKG